MKTVNAGLCTPKHDCWAFQHGECQILTTTHCKSSDKCGHYQTEIQRAQGLKKGTGKT